MSKVGEYYRELSELGINPRDIRKKPVKKKAVPLHDRRFYSGEERRKNSGIARNKFTWGWQGGMANSGIKITEEEYRKNYRNGITEVYLMKKEKEADKKSKFFKDMEEKYEMKEEIDEEGKCNDGILDISTAQEVLGDPLDGEDIW